MTPKTKKPRRAVQESTVVIILYLSFCLLVNQNFLWVMLWFSLQDFSHASCLHSHNCCSLVIVICFADKLMGSTIVSQPPKRTPTDASPNVRTCYMLYISIYKSIRFCESVSFNNQSTTQGTMKNNLRTEEKEKYSSHLVVSNSFSCMLYSSHG